MRATLSEGLHTLLKKDFKDKADFEHFIEHIHNIVPQFVKVGDIKYFLIFERIQTNDNKAR